MSSLNTCQECGPLYYFDHNFRICIQGTQPGCLIYRARNICVQCETGFRNDAGICKRCEIARCSNCSVSVKQCMQCRRGFTFTTAVALPAGSPPEALISTTSPCDRVCSIQNCRSCMSGNSNFCAICMDGFRRSLSDQCELCGVPGCRKCNSSVSTCDPIGLTAAELYNQNIALQNVLVTTSAPTNSTTAAGVLANAILFATANDFNCLDGFYFDQTKCVACQNGCRVCRRGNGTCMTCDTERGFFMNSAQTCQLIVSVFSRLISPLIILIFFSLLFLA